MTRQPEHYSVPRLPDSPDSATTTQLRLGIMSLWLVILSLGLIGSLAGIISARIEQEPGKNGEE